MLLSIKSVDETLLKIHAAGSSLFRETKMFLPYKKKYVSKVLSAWVVPLMLVKHLRGC